MSDVASLIAAANATKQKGRVGLKSASSASDGAPAYTKRNPPVRPTAATWKRKSTTVSVPSRSAIKTMAVKDGYANSVTNLIDYSASRCKEVFKQIQDACVATGKPYFDDTFFFGDRNAMYPDGTPADCTVTEPQAVERLSVLFPNVPVFAQTTDSLDIDQGAMGDCFFIGAAAALASCSAQHLNPVGRLFVASDVANGIYGLVFYKDGGWEWVIIDDLVAVDPQSRAPLYACATGNAELWPMLLEKAYAKMHYCWDTIDGGWEREALADMTGGKEYTINLYNGPDKDMTFDQFKVLVDNVHTVLGCAVGKQVQNSNATGHAGEEGAVFGLFKGHAYSVLQAVKCSDGAGFVRVRNPWGNDAEWKGPYCDRDKMWDKHPVHFNEVKPNFANDGAFWMKWDDFRQYFTDIDVCEYFDPTWNCVCLFGKSNRDPLCANQTYLLELSNIDGSSKDIEVVLTLGQEDPKAQSDHGKAKNCAYATLRLAVYALTGKPDSFAHLKNFLGNKIETRQLYNRQVDEHIKLPPGRYSLCPKVTDAPAGTGYNIRVLAPSTAAICIQRFDDPVNTTRQIGFQGVPSELAEDAAFVKAQQSRSFKGKNLKASTGVEDGAPEYVLRNPRLQPTAATIKRKSTTVTTATRSTIKPLAQKASYGATVSAIYDTAVQACKAAVDAVVAACKTAGDKPFFDQSFHYGDRNSLYPDGTPADCTVTEPQAVERLSVLYPNAPLFGAAVDSLDIDQGSMGDCFFIGATSALASSTAQHLNPVGRLFAASDLKYGVYGLVFYKNGGWEWVIIDDFIAIDPQSKEPLYASATNNAELWPIVLEKAYAKLHYCWDTIDGGWEREALADMTGGKEYSINLLDDHKDMTFDEFKSHVDNIHTVMGCAVNKNVQDSNAVGHAGEEGAVFGLFKGHAYSVLQAVKCSDGAGFVRVRNPWGNDAEWKGAYCDRDKAWEDNPLHKREVKPNFANDGAFWMKWDDFRQYFCDIDVCEYTDFTWNTLTFFGSSNVPATCANQTYIMELRHASGSDDPVDVILTMGQEDPKSQPDHAKAKNSAYGYIKLSCYQLTNVPTSYSQMSSCLGTKIETKKVYNRGVDNHIKLSPGKYSLVPTIDRAPAKTGYYVRVFAPSDVTISMYRFDSPSDVVSAKGVLAANAGTTPAAAPAAATPAPSATAATPAAAAPAPTPTPPTVVVAGPAGAAFRGGGAAVITPAAAPVPAAPVIPSIVTNANADGGLTFHRTPGGFAAAVATGFSVADPVGRGSVDSNGAMIALGQLFLRSDIATAFAKAVHDAGTVDKATFQRLLERAMEDHGL